MAPRRPYFNGIMLPLIAVGIAAAAAGWAGANLYRRLRHGAEEKPAEGGQNAAFGGVEARRRTSRQLAWCPACRSYVVAGEAHDCGGPP